MEALEIIPTRYKSPIPKTHSYPIGAQAISDALRGVPQFSALALRFWFRKPIGRCTAPEEPTRVLQAAYSSSSFELGWTIWIYAVPRGLRHEVQNTFLIQGLPALRTWLEQNNHGLQRDGHHTITFQYEEVGKQLTWLDHSSLEWQTPEGRE